MHATQEHATTAHTHDRGKLWELIKDIKLAMFTTRHRNGHLHSRPMTTQNDKIDENSSLWFFMSRRSDPVADVAEHRWSTSAMPTPATTTTCCVG